MLAKDHTRKFTAFYVGIEKLGALLQMSQFWLPCGVVRTSIVKKTAGGLGAFFAELLKLAFVGNDSLTHGILVRLDPGVQSLLFGSYAGLLSDEAALHSCLNLKGASGTRLC